MHNFKLPFSRFVRASAGEAVWRQRQRCREPATVGAPLYRSDRLEYVHDMKFSRLLIVLSLGCLLGPSTSSLAAQSLPTPTTGNSIRSRADLEALVRQYEDLLASTAYSDELKDDARSRIEQIRERLEVGDFRLGDAVVLSVDGEPNLPDTVAVQSSPDGPMIALPMFGEIPLQGVLRSELEGRITEALSRYIRTPVVRAQGLMRLSVQGAVGSPGFYVVPADMLVSQALMVAGGPAQNAALGGLRIERGVETLLEGDQLQEELRLGSTLDQLNLQAGDQLVLPADTPGGVWGRIGLVAGILTSVTFLIVQIAR